MLVSKILKELGIECAFFDERQFNSLGLVNYNFREGVCTFVESEKYLNELSEGISMLITNEHTAKLLSETELNIGICIVENPRTTFFKIHNYLSEKDNYGIKPVKTKIGRNCDIGSRAIISNNNVIIGDSCKIEDFAIIKENTIIGNNTIVRSGSVIGGQGFEFKKELDCIFPVAHVGKVIIGNNVEIQYNSCVDKAVYPWDSTVISDYVKIDNLVHIGHGAKIGERTMIIANSGIGGRTIIGKDAWIGFGATLRNGIQIGDNAKINMGAVVTKDVGNNCSVSGNFAIDHDAFINKLRRELV